MRFLKRDIKSSFEIVVDTNILFSAILYPDGTPRRLFTLAEEKGATIVVLDYSIEELMDIFLRKGLDFRPARLFIDTCKSIELREIGEISDDDARIARETISDEEDRALFVYAYRRIRNGKDCFLITGDKGLLTPPVKDALKGRVYKVSDFIEIWDDFRFVSLSRDDKP